MFAEGEENCMAWPIIAGVRRSLWFNNGRPSPEPGGIGPVPVASCIVGNGCPLGHPSRGGAGSNVCRGAYGGTLGASDTQTSKYDI